MLADLLHRTVPDLRRLSAQNAKRGVIAAASTPKDGVSSPGGGGGWTDDLHEVECG